jgi:hypothetical protein
LGGYRIDLDICISGATVLHGGDLHGQLPWLGNGYRTSGLARNRRKG